HSVGGDRPRFDRAGAQGRRVRRRERAGEMRRVHRAAAGALRGSRRMTARVGLIVPSSNRMVEQEMARFFPAGVALHVARLRMTGPHHVPLDALLPRIEEATRTLTDAKCDVIAFHCTATSMEEGMAGEERVLAAVARAGSPRVTSTATAIRRAFDALGARRIVLVTPYSAQTTEEEAEFLRA